MPPQSSRKGKARAVSPLPSQIGSPVPHDNNYLPSEATDEGEVSIFSRVKKKFKSSPASVSGSSTSSRSVTPQPPKTGASHRFSASNLGKWELDKVFLEELKHWERDHPRKTLNKILQKVNKAVQKGKPWMEVIPDAPFPAQSLVKGLAQVLLLAASLADANHKLQNFVMDVVAWITRLKENIASFRNPEFDMVEFKDLAIVQKIIHKICEWAKSRLVWGTLKHLIIWLIVLFIKVDKRWKKLNLESEIAEFETQVQKARQIFIEMSLITISGNVFHLQKILEEILGAHKAQEEEIAAEKARREVLHRALDPHTAQQSTYDQQGKLPCDAGSREDVLATIWGWINDHHPMTSQNFLWLTGAPGCGKSAVTATIAQEAKDRRILWAQFFINRNLAHTTDPNMYFPSIARQLSDFSVKVERHVHNTIQEAPSVADHISPRQAAELFVGAVAEACKFNPKMPVLVIIDGLDETNRNHLDNTAIIFSHLFAGLSTYPNAKIMIASRTEQQIHKPFTKTLTSNHVKRLHLHTEDSVTEVGNFFRKHLQEVAENHDLDPTLWPGKGREELLVKQADGLYIWAVTVTKFLNARLRMQGRMDPYRIIDQLKLPDKVDINELYQKILQLTYEEEYTTEWDLETFRRIIGAILVARKPLRVAELEHLLDLRDPASSGSSDRVDILNFVNLLRTVLISEMDTVSETTVIRLHKSFFEFATENSEMRFRVDLTVANAEMTLRCLKHIAKSYAGVASTQFASSSADLRDLPHSARYAFDYCLSHAPQDRHMLGIVLDHPNMTLSQFNAVLMSCSSNALPLSIGVQNNPSIITTSLHSHSMFWDYNSGSPTIPNSIHVPNPWRVTVSPDGRYCGCNVEVIDLQTLELLKYAEASAMSELFKLAGCTVFSPDGSYSATACDDGGIELYNLRSESLERYFETDAAEGESSISLAFASDSIRFVYATTNGILMFNAHTDDVEQIVRAPLARYLPVVLSPDGSCILSSTTTDNALLFWDLVTGQQIGEPFIGHTAEVYSAAFSPNSQYIASCDEDYMFRLWDVKSRQQLGDPIYGFHSVSFSPDGSYVLLTTGCGFQLREIPTMRTLAEVPMYDDGSFYANITITPDEPTYFSKGSLSYGTITPDGQHAIVTDLESDRMFIFNLSPHIFHIKNTLRVKWSALSIPNGNLFVYMDSDNALSLSRPASNRFGGRPLPRGNSHIPVISVVFSPDERHIAGICEDGLIHLWNTEDYTLIGTHQNPSSHGIIPGIWEDWLIHLLNTDYTFVGTHQNSPSHGITSLAFAPDGISIVVQTGIYKTLLTPLNDQLVPYDDIWTVPDVSPPTLIPDLSINPHVYSDSRNSSLQSVRWFPTTSYDVLWAYVDNHIIRAGTDGGFVVVPVNMVE
ncbi:hypothetical protein H0H87_003346 [Tephrocybe sp. NHM501043]|nr:hypothetical protein H0H87_003346 [Tephrocybe sp. NHM501043]